MLYKRDRKFRCAALLLLTNSCVRCCFKNVVLWDDVAWTGEGDDEDESREVEGEGRVAIAVRTLREAETAVLRKNLDIFERRQKRAALCLLVWRRKGLGCDERQVVLWGSPQ